MTDRITVVLDSEIVKTLRNHQASIIKKTGKNCSFSNVVNLALELGVKGLKP